MATALAPSVAHAVIAEGAVKAALIYNFAKFIDWPPKAFASQEAPLTVCLYRDQHSDLHQALSAFTGRSVQGRPIALRTGVVHSTLAGCHVLFIPEGQERWLADLLPAAHARHILTVSDSDDFLAAGGMIELSSDDGRPRFSINLNAAREARLKMSAQLLKLAKTVLGTPEGAPR